MWRNFFIYATFKHCYGAIATTSTTASTASVMDDYAASPAHTHIHFRVLLLPLDADDPITCEDNAYADCEFITELSVDTAVTLYPQTCKQDWPQSAPLSALVTSSSVVLQRLSLLTLFSP